MQQIDLQKVLLITNSDIAQSGLDAADYVVKRNLNPAHILAFGFGTNDVLDKRNTPTLLYSSGPTCTTAGPYYGMYFYGALAAYYAANQIEAVILSTYTPASVTIGIAVGWEWPLAAYAGIAWYCNNPVRGVSSSPAFLTPYFDPYNTTTSLDPWTTINNVAQQWKPGYTTPNPRNPYNLIPFGRLGNPVTGGTIAEYGIDASVQSPPGETCYQHAVRTALLGEAQNQSTAQQGLSTTLKYDGFTVPASNQAAYDFATSVGLNVAKLDYSLHTYPYAYVHAADTSIPVVDSTGFPASGVVRVDYEYLSYTTLLPAAYLVTETGDRLVDGAGGYLFSPATLTGLSRALTGPVGHPYENASAATDHPTSSPIYTIAPPLTAPGTYFMQDYGQPGLDSAFTDLHSICVNASYNGVYTDQTSAAIVGKLANGAWSYVWTSSSNILGISFLQAGASTAIMSVSEPGANWLPMAQEVYILASAYQIPLMLAQFLSHAGDNIVVGGNHQPFGTCPCGDPLNTPYKSTFTSYSFAVSGAYTTGELSYATVWGTIGSGSSGAWASIRGAPRLVTEDGIPIVTELGQYIVVSESPSTWSNIPASSTPSWVKITPFET
jgi:hypothetical protein